MDFLFNEAEHLIERKPLNAKERSWLGKISVVSDNLPQKIPQVKPRIFALVSNALYDNHPIQISYQKKTGDVIAREIEPLALVQQNFRLYLIARYSHAQENSYRHFALHRITDAAEVDRSFIPPEDFSLSDYLRERDFNYSDETRIRWTLEFSNPEGARLLREAPFNTDQTITELPDGFFRLEVTLPNTRHIDAWLAMWAGINGVRLSQKEKLYPSDSDRSTLPK
jgi:predicted DNA-binding transcriptional regulator YafY